MRMQLVGCHRQDQIDRLASHLVHHDGRIAEGQPEQPDHARHAWPRRVPRRSTACRRSGWHRRRARHTRRTCASRSSVSGSIVTSTPSTCAIQRRIASASAASPRAPGGEIDRHVETGRCAPNNCSALSSLIMSISASAGMPSIETSGDTGVLTVPAMVSSSAAISEPSCKVTRWVRKNSLGGAQHDAHRRSRRARCAGSRARAD